MEGCYEVFNGNDVVGKVQLIRQGLYYRVICRCCLSEDMVRRLYAVQENSRENLGVLVPEEDGLVLDKKIPVKRISDKTTRFLLSAGDSKMRGKLVPVSPEEPFLYIDRLKSAFLETENGKVNIRIEESPEAV